MHGMMTSSTLTLSESTAFSLMVHAQSEISYSRSTQLAIVRRYSTTTVWVPRTSVADTSIISCGGTGRVKK